MKKIGKRQEGGRRRKESAIFHRHPLFSRKTRNRPTWPKGPTDSSAARFIFSADRPSRSFMMISRFRVPPPFPSFTLPPHLRNIAGPLRGKWETRFPNHRNKLRQPAVSATSAKWGAEGKVTPWEPTAKRCKATRTLKWPQSWIIQVSLCSLRMALALSRCLTNEFSKLRNKPLIFLPSFPSTLRTWRNVLWYSHAYILYGKTRVNLDSSNFIDILVSDPTRCGTPRSKSTNPTLLNLALFPSFLPLLLNRCYVVVPILYHDL